MRIFLVLIATMMVVISAIGVDAASATPSAPIRVTLIQAECEVDGSVSGLVTAQNLTKGKVSYSIPLVLAEHVPPSRGGDAKFQSVPGASTVVTANLPGEATLGFGFGPLPTANVDPQANSLRVEVAVAADSTLNWEKSESFPPCGIPAPTPTPPPTPEPTSEAIPTPTMTPVIELPWSAPPEPTPTPAPTQVPTPSPTPDSEMPMAFPDSGGETPAVGEDGVIGWELLLTGGAILTLFIFAHKVWLRPSRRR